MSYNNINPIVNELYIGSDGVRYAKEMTNEQHTVNNSKIVLNGLPDNGYRISVEYNGALMVEIPIRELIEDERNFKVDYSYGYIYFHPNLEGKNIVVKEYHSRGLSYFPANRVYTELDEWGRVRETLADSATMINKVSAIADSLPSMLQDMLEREQSLIDASARVKEQEDIIANFQADFERVETIAQEATAQAEIIETALQITQSRIEELNGVVNKSELLQAQLSSENGLATDLINQQEQIIANSQQERENLQNSIEDTQNQVNQFITQSSERIDGILANFADDESRYNNLRTQVDQLIIDSNEAAQNLQDMIDGSDLSGYATQVGLDNRVRFVTETQYNTLKTNNNIEENITYIIYR